MKTRTYKIYEEEPQSYWKEDIASMIIFTVWLFVLGYVALKYHGVL